MTPSGFSSGIGYVQTPDGISIRYGHWPCRGNTRGTVVLLNGRSEFLEKYTETVAVLNQKGFDVFSLDWRGQGLSTRLLPHWQKGHVHRFEDYLTDLDTVLARVVFPKSGTPLFFLAHSMGGHVAMRYLLETSQRQKALASAQRSTVSDKTRGNKVHGAVLSSPMMGIYTKPFPVWFVQSLSKAMVKAGFGSAYALGSRDYDPARQVFKGNLLTSDPVRYQDHVNAVKENPLLAVGGVTYGWLRAAFESMAALNHPTSIEPKGMPILIAGAEADKIVTLSAQKDLCSRLAGCTFKLIPGARHEILKEADPIQALFWSAFDDFVMNLI